MHVGWRVRAVGAIVGAAVGDALGAPFEFGPAGAFSARFPVVGAGGEMCGGGGWEPGEATDDTQMAVLAGESLIEQGGLDLPDVFGRFQRIRPHTASADTSHPRLTHARGRVPRRGAGDQALRVPVRGP